MTDERDNRRRPHDWPLSGPPSDEEITDRHSALGEHPALQAAFVRLQRQREEDRRALEAQLVALAEQMRSRDHSIRNDLSAAIVQLREAHYEHDVLDEQRHVDLAGRPGGGPESVGRVGALEAWRRGVGKLVVAIAAAAAGSLITAILAWRSAAYVQGGKDRAAEQVAAQLEANAAELAVIKAVLYANGILKVPDGAIPLPSLIAPDPGVTP